jgi:hypothetical protein
MNEQYTLFKKLLAELNKVEILPHLILIGSWCLFVYRTYYHDTSEIPLLRTVDIDFLIPRPFKFTGEINIHDLLKKLGFDERFSSMSGQIKYVHPELEVEFLTPELGKGSHEPYKVKSLHLNAQQLRYLTLLQNFTLTIPFENIHVTVPEPAAFVLHKFILTKKRANMKKYEKDLQAAVELGEFLTRKSHEQKRMKDIFITLPAGWQKIILEVTEHTSPTIYQLLKESF